MLQHQTKIYEFSSYNVVGLYIGNGNKPRFDQLKTMSFVSLLHLMFSFQTEPRHKKELTPL